MRWQTSVKNAYKRMRSRFDYTFIALKIVRFLWHDMMFYLVLISPQIKWPNSVWLTLNCVISGENDPFNCCALASVLAAIENSLCKRFAKEWVLVSEDCIVDIRSDVGVIWKLLFIEYATNAVQLQHKNTDRPDYGRCIVGKRLGLTTSTGPTKDGCIIFWAYVSQSSTNVLCIASTELSTFCTKTSRLNTLLVYDLNQCISRPNSYHWSYVNI